MNLTDIAEALAQAIESGTGIKTYSFVPDENDLPAVVIQPPQEVRVKTLGRGLNAGHEADFLVTVAVPRWNEESGQTDIRNYMSPGVTGSVWRVIDDQTDLNGTVSSVRVVRANSTTFRQAGQDFLAADFEVTIVS